MGRITPDATATNAWLRLPPETLAAGLTQATPILRALLVMIYNGVVPSGDDVLRTVAGLETSAPVDVTPISGQLATIAPDVRAAIAAETLARLSEVVLATLAQSEVTAESIEAALGGAGYRWTGAQWERSA